MSLNVGWIRLCFVFFPRLAIYLAHRFCKSNFLHSMTAPGWITRALINHIMREAMKESSGKTHMFNSVMQCVGWVRVATAQWTHFFIPSTMYVKLCDKWTCRDLTHRIFEIGIWIKRFGIKHTLSFAIEMFLNGTLTELIYSTSAILTPQFVTLKFFQSFHRK